MRDDDARFLGWAKGRLLVLLFCSALGVACSGGGKGGSDTDGGQLADGGTSPDGGTHPDGGTSGPSAFFLPNTYNGAATNLRGTTVAVDASGGVHVASLDFIDSVPMYRFCAGSCDDASKFTGVDFPPEAGGVAYVSLALDPNGHPRLLWDVYQGFAYASCDAGCTTASGWTVTRVVAKGDPGSGSARRFALDAQGRPRAIFASHTDPDVGTYFDSCDADCGTGSNWTEVKISDAELSRPSLAIGADGRARFLALDQSVDRSTAETSGMTYIECADAACSSLSGVNLPSVNNLAGDLSLQLGGGDLPRAAVYTGSLDAPNVLDPNAVEYLWCDSACADGANNTWAAANTQLAIGDSGGLLALALDAQGHPRLAVKTDEGMGYAWCDAGCQSSGGSWTLGAVEAASQLATATPPSGCGVVGWTFGDEAGGAGISLALDPQGNPRLAYDARHLVLCSGHVETSIEWPRFSAFTAP
jgi:hypothetical protein